nr:hypothetical protein [Paraburkholderia sacchari]
MRTMTRQGSLRSLVEKWLGPATAQALRVTRFSRSCARPWRYVCVEMTRSSGDVALVFFRHDDGSWCVFPPMAARPAIRVPAYAALASDCGVLQWIRWNAPSPAGAALPNIRAER